MIRLEVPAHALEAARSIVLDPASAATDFERELAAKSRVLPIYGDLVGWWAWRMDGTLVFKADEPGAVFETVEDDPAINRGLHAALILTGTRHPALDPYLPARPTDAVTCTHCDGRGSIGGMPAGILCECAGAGWVPAEWVCAPSSDPWAGPRSTSHLGSTTAAARQSPPSPEGERRSFVAFVRRLRSGALASDDWSTHVATHYENELVERYRRALAAGSFSSGATLDAERIAKEALTELDPDAG